MRSLTNARVSSVFKVLGALGLVGVGIGSGLLLHSPGESITYDLPPSHLTAEVTSQELSTDLTGSGVFQSAGQISISAEAPVDRSLVVTKTPLSSGQQVSWCEVLVEASGRPIFILQGDIPAYRNLTEGDSGQDVRQLQEALRTCGYRVLADGEFGAETAKAIKKLYADAGYSAVTDLTDALGPAASQGAQPEELGVGNASLTSAESFSGVVAPPDLETVPVVVETVLISAQEDNQTDSQNDKKSGEVAETSGEDTPPKPPSVYAPRGEIRFIKSTPKVLSQQPEGSEPQGEAIVKLSLVGDLFIASLPAEHIVKVEKGQEVQINYLEWSGTAVLPVIPGTPTYGSGVTPILEIPISLTEPIPEDAYEEMGQFIIMTGSDRVFELVVPVSAINQDTSGQPYVWRPKVMAADGTPRQSDLERIDVTVLESAGGYVAIDVLGGALVVGDAVVIGKA